MDYIEEKKNYRKTLSITLGRAKINQQARKLYYPNTYFISANMNAMHKVQVN